MGATDEGFIFFTHFGIDPLEHLARPEENPQPHDIRLACTPRDTGAKIQLIPELLRPILWENCQVFVVTPKAFVGNGMLMGESLITSNKHN